LALEGYENLLQVVRCIFILVRISLSTLVRIDKNDFLQRPEDTSSRPLSPDKKRRVSAAIRKKNRSENGEGRKSLVNRGRVAEQGSISRNTNQSEDLILVPPPETTHTLIDTLEPQQRSGDTQTQMELNPLVGVVGESEPTDSTQWPFYQSTSPAECPNCEVFLYGVSLILVLANFDFTISPAEVKERAAWSWYRTALICERSAMNLKTGGLEQKSLGIESIGASE
jgi:hypothetical protein